MILSGLELETQKRIWDRGKSLSPSIMGFKSLHLPVWSECLSKCDTQTDQIRLCVYSRAAQPCPGINHVVCVGLWRGAKILSGKREAWVKWAAQKCFHAAELQPVFNFLCISVS
uniref:Uncharacterized protein n=1 Tax=Anguilla anguilla TaxID=7936 RepID=A0A0E9W8B4_ANGAN